MLLASAPVWATASCQELADRIEAELFERPNDAQLLAAWQALAACKDAPDDQSSASGSHTSYAVGLWQGYDTNPAFASYHASLQLTTPVGPLILPLQRPVASASRTLQAMAWHKNDWGQQVYFAQYKQFNDNRIGDHWLLSVEQQLNWQSHQVNLALRSVSAFGLQLRQWQISDSYPITEQWELTGEMRWRRFNDMPELESDTFLIGVKFKAAHWPVQAKLAIGIDSALDQRAGGDQQLIEANVQWYQQWQGHQFSVLVLWRQQQDKQGYSDWLANNATRSITQQGLVLQWQAPPLWQHVYPQLQLDWNEQQANLPLFAWQNISLRAGLWWSW